MKRFPDLCRYACLLGLLVACGTPAWADPIYRWTDADGVVHFSQTPPPADRPVETVEIEDSRPSDYDPEADIYGVAEHIAVTVLPTGALAGELNV